MRTIQPNSQQAAAVGRLLQRLKWSQVGIVYTDDDYGHNLSSALLDNMETYGLSIEWEGQTSLREIPADFDDDTVSEVR